MAGSVFFKTSSTIPGQWPSGREVANTTTTRTANFPLLHLAPPPPKWLLVPRSYAVPGQWQGTYQDKLEIIGDKKGGTTSAILANKPEELDRVRDLVKGKTPLPCFGAVVIEGSSCSLLKSPSSWSMSSAILSMPLQRTPRGRGPPLPTRNGFKSFSGGQPDPR